MRRRGVHQLRELKAWTGPRMLDGWWSLRLWAAPRLIGLSVVVCLVGFVTIWALIGLNQTKPAGVVRQAALTVSSLPAQQQPLEAAAAAPERTSEPEIVFEEPSVSAIETGPSSIPSVPRFLDKPAITISRRLPDLLEPLEREAWQVNAIPVTLGTAPKIALVIDDLGPAYRAALATIDLPAPLTLAFLPYAEGLEELTGKAHAAGHELLVHMPWEPIDLAHNNPGPNALLTSLDAAELQRRLDWALERFPGYVGLNNHMGSAFSTYDPGLTLVMQDLKKRGLLFLDSRTIGASHAMDLALQQGVPAAGRDIFLDHQQNDPAFVWQQLALLEAIARQRGSAVAIGHPHATTLEVLRAWLPQAVAEGFQLVPISALVQVPAQTVEGAPASTASLLP